MKDKYRFYYLRKGRKTLKKRSLKLVFAGKNVAEAKIPLAQILKINKIKPTKNIRISAGTINTKNPKKSDYTKYIHLNPKLTNYALHLLLFMMSKEAYIKDDPISISLALANNYLYSVANEETRREIKKDLIKHFNLYKKIVKWQENLKIKYKLKDVGVIPKIVWGYRLRYMDSSAYGKKLTLKMYKEFVNRVDFLEEIHDDAIKVGFENAESLALLAKKLEGYVKKNRLYRAARGTHWYRLRKNPKEKSSRRALWEIKKGKHIVKYLGVKRRWDKFPWMNYQWNRFKQCGKFRGDCVTTTTMQMAYYKMVGIPSFPNQVRSLRRGGFSHNSPIFYNAFFKRWVSIQKPRPRRRDKYFYHYMRKPIWHHKIYEMKGDYYEAKGRKVLSPYYPGETAKADQILTLRKIGIDDRHFERILFSHKTDKKGLIYHKGINSKKVIDQDHDGIIDDLEKLNEMNPNNPDTDNDGYADLWEIERGYNPKEADSPNEHSILALDGLSKLFVKKNKLPTVYSKKRGYKAKKEIFDVKTFSGKIVNNHLYLAVSYYNDISKNKQDIHAFKVVVKDKKGKKAYLIQLINNKALIYKYEAMDSYKFNKLYDVYDIQYNIVKDAEFLIPLKINIFKDAQAIFINYYSSGKIGKRILYTDDRSEVLRFDLVKNEKKEKSNLSFNFKDAKNDYKAKYNIYDLNKMNIQLSENNIEIYVNFYNDIKKNQFTTHQFEFYDFQTHKKVKIMIKNPYLAQIINEDGKKSFNNFDVIKKGNGYLFIFEKKLVHISNFLTVQYHVGGRSSKYKRIISSDSSAQFMLEEQKVVKNKAKKEKKS